MKNQVRIVFVLTILVVAIISVNAGMWIARHQKVAFNIMGSQVEWRVQRPTGMPNLSIEELDKVVTPEDFRSIDFNLRDGTVVSLVRTNM